MTGVSSAEKRVYLASNGKTLLCRGCNQKAISENDSYHDICMKRVAPSPAARDRLNSLRIDVAFGAFWIVMAVLVLFLPPQDLWPSLACVCWAALGGYIVGQALQERRHERGE